MRTIYGADNIEYAETPGFASGFVWRFCCLCISYLFLICFVLPLCFNFVDIRITDFAGVVVVGIVG